MNPAAEPAFARSHPDVAAAVAVLLEIASATVPMVGPLDAADALHERAFLHVCRWRPAQVAKPLLIMLWDASESYETHHLVLPVLARVEELRSSSLAPACFALALLTHQVADLDLPRDPSVAATLIVDLLIAVVLLREDAGLPPFA